MSLLRTSWEKVLPAITPHIPETEDQLETWAKSPVDPLTKARMMRVLFSNKTDEAKRVIEERQNYEGYSIIGGYFVNAILEPIGIAQGGSKCASWRAGLIDNEGSH